VDNDYFYVDEDGIARGVRYLDDYMGDAVIELPNGIQKRVDYDQLKTTEEWEEKAHKQ
jgi:hypothetical protein